MDWKTGGRVFVIWLILLVTGIENGNAEQRIVCYYTNWSVYRPGTAKYSPQNINPYLCTHLIYAFGGFTKDNTLKPFDKYQDIEKGGYAKFTGLKTYNKNLKTMLAIGGWNEGSSRFSPMVADPDRRRELVKNAVKFLRQNHFDGLDLDWEYPAFRDGGKPRDRDNYADLVQELREEFERESSKTGRPKLLLSMAVPAGIEYLEKGYDLARLNEYLDFFNLLSYDYHSAFEPSANHHAPLYGLEEDNEYNYDSELTIDFTINYLLKHEVSSEKIVLGIPTYGRSYTLVNGDTTEIGAPAEGPGEEGEATREKGYLAYYEICENIAKNDEWEVVQPNPKAMGPYAFKGNQWVGYDDESIVRMKALYVNEKKLGGIMFWSIDNDDFRGKCHGRPYPLIEGAKEALLTGRAKSNSRQKPKSNVNHKKTKIQSSQREQEETIDRKLTSGQRRTTSSNNNNKIQPTRKRIFSSRSNVRSNSKTHSQEDHADEDNLEENEQNGNSLREGSNKNRAKPRTRIRAGGRRKEQSSKRNEEIESSDSESLSNQLTTPEPPTTPDPGSDFKCEDEGFFSHPRDCKKYFWCLDSGPGGLGVVAHQFTCPSGLVFNKAADSCDYPRNVICPKAKINTPTTTKAPITAATSRTTFAHSSTRRTTKTTTNEPEEEEEEEYEYEDEVNSAEEPEISVSTTAKTLLYKSISRSRPTTTTQAATTTETQTTILPRSSKPIEKETDFEDEEDPRVIKELIDLIKKAGGLEQLEKQFNYQEKNSGKETTEVSGGSTQATISRSLYERVLSRKATKVNTFFGSSTPRTTTANSRTHYLNGPGRSQFEGLDDVPEVKSLRKTKKPQYVTIERQRSTTQEVSDNEEDEEIEASEEIDQDNANVASSEDRAVSNLPEIERKSSNKRVTPSYVNIRRSRPTTPASENDLENKEETSNEPESQISAQESNEKIENEEEEEEEVPPSSKERKKSEESVVQNNRYTNTHRFRSTTSKSSDFTNEEIKPVEEVSISSTTFATTEEPKISEKPVFTTIQSSVTPIYSTEREIISSSNLAEENPIVTTELSVKLVDNSVTETLLTTIPAISSTRIPSTSRTTTTTTTPVVSQPRPFGFARRGRPTTTTTTTTDSSSSVPSSTESSRAKVSNRPTRNFARPSNAYANRVRSRNTSTTDEIKSNDKEQNVISTTEATKYTGRRRGVTRFTTESSVKSTTDEIEDVIHRGRTKSSPVISPSTEANLISVETKPHSFPSRRRGKPTASPQIEETTEDPEHRRLETIPKNPYVSDSPIIRIAQDSSDLLQQSRSKFIGNNDDSEDKITNIRVFKVQEEIPEKKIELNVIETSTLESEITRPESSYSTTSPTTVTVISSSSELTTEITDNKIQPTEEIFTSVPTNNTYLDNSSESLTTDNDSSVKRIKPVRRRVSVRRRPVSSTTETNEESSVSENSLRRRKIIRRIRPVTNNTNEIAPSNDEEILSSHYNENSTTLKSATESIEMTTENVDINEVITTDSAINMSTLDSTIAPTIFDFTTESSDAEVDFTTLIEEKDILSTVADDNQEETEPAVVVTSTTPLTTTTTDDSPSRFIRRKFVRKRPVSFSSTKTTTTTTTTPISSTVARRFGVSRNQIRPTVEPSGLSGSNRRKSLYVRRRPVSTTSATSDDDRVMDHSDEPKVEMELEHQELPTLKELIGEVAEPTSTVTVGLPTPSGYNPNENSLNDVPDDRIIGHEKSQLHHANEQFFDTKNNQGIKVPVRILDLGDSNDNNNNQFAFLSLPPGDFASKIGKNILRIQVIEQDNNQDDDDLNVIESQRVPKSRRVWTDSNSRRRRTRVRSRPEGEENITRRTVSRRRGTPRIHSIVQDSNDTSSIEIPVTTVKPTTIRGSYVPFTTTETLNRGFFITKSNDETPLTMMTMPITDSEAVRSNFNYQTTEIPSTTEQNEGYYSTSVKSIFDESSIEQSSDESGEYFGSTTSKVFEGMEDLLHTTNFPKVSHIVDESTTSITSTTTSTIDKENDENLWTFMTKYFDATTIATTMPEKGEQTISLETQTEFPMTENSENIFPSNNYSQDTVEVNDKSTIISVSTTESPQTTYYNEISNEAENNSFSYSTVKVPNDDLRNIQDFQNDLNESTTLASTTTEEIETSSISMDEIPRMTTASVINHSSFVTEKNPIPTTIAVEIIPLTTEQKTELSTKTIYISTSTTEPSPIIEYSRENHRPSPRRTRGKVRYQAQSRTEEFKERKSTRKSTVHRHPVKEISENPINESATNESAIITESPINKTSQEFTSGEVEKVLPEVVSSPHRRRNNRNRLRTSSISMQSFNVTTEIPQRSSRKRIVQRRDQTEPTDDQSIAESNLFEAAEVGLRTSGIFLRRPGNLARPAFAPVKSQSSAGATSERRFSSKFDAQKSEIYDQSGRAQELTVALVDPPTMTTFSETGVETSSILRGDKKHQNIKEISETTDAPVIMRTTTPARRRQKPKSNEKIEKVATSMRPRHPAIIDYDYYVDEEVHYSIKPELKGKIFITPGGRIGCLDQGTFAHPISCKKFVTCAQSAGRKIIATEYTCPNKLSFDPVGGICNWSAGLGCNDH